jgi:sulfur carrier protein ThiS adenylyltransferase
MTDKHKVDKIFERNVPNLRQILSKKVVGIAGCGGLGSNAAIALCRAGIGKLVIADQDIVELSNLNRQYFFLHNVGEKKIEALSSLLFNINPEILIDSHFLELTSQNISKIFGEVDLLIEAFDRAESKAWLIETWCLKFPDRPIVCASGLAGYGNTSTLMVNRSGPITICGDFETDMSMGLTSSRVAIVANMQANEAIELLLKD